ncbi:probable glutathione S-transferase [Phalaenopsis equestris]|uniref:probable glutathione S-transferase n=1 Tax=Phalaenopsis equestris TaxID=78828 RepID=UPI0009E31F79|nr:probable glutathione S-transferase [Phalaenopsis equestris]
MADEVKLLGSCKSPFSRRVEIALKLKGASFELSDLDVFFSKPPELLQHNPVHKKIPVLLHRGKAIAESLVILEYVDEVWSSSGIRLLPEDAYERAMARFWAKFFDDKCIQPLWMSCWTKGDMQKHLLEESKLHLTTMEGALKDKKFFGGEEIGLVDIVVLCSVYWAQIAQDVFKVDVISEEKHPILCRWMKEITNSDVLKDCLPPRDELFLVFQTNKDDIAALMTARYGSN